MSWYDDNIGITDPESMSGFDYEEYYEENIDHDIYLKYQEAYNTPSKWVTRYGEILLIKNMTTQHIRNCIRCIDEGRITIPQLIAKRPVLQVELQNRLR